MEEQELYEKVCQPRLKRIEDKLDNIDSLLRGENKESGLVDEVRELKKVYKYVVGAVIFVVSAIALQFIAWLKQKFLG